MVLNTVPGNHLLGSVSKATTSPPSFSILSPDGVRTPAFSKRCLIAWFTEMCFCSKLHEDAHTFSGSLLYKNKYFYMVTALCKWPNSVKSFSC